MHTNGLSHLKRKNGEKGGKLHAYVCTFNATLYPLGSYSTRYAMIRPLHSSSLSLFKTLR